jgi:hypothetical protein
MPTEQLIVGGVFTLDTVDFSDAITHAVLKVTADEVEVPATLGAPKAKRKGGLLYEIELNYLSSDAAAQLFTALWTAAETDTGEADFTLKMRDGAISTDNPEWSGTLIVMGAAVGGDAEALSEDSQTFSLTGAPTKDTTP